MSEKKEEVPEPSEIVNEFLVEHIQYVPLKTNTGTFILDKSQLPKNPITKLKFVPGIAGNNTHSLANFLFSAIIPSEDKEDDSVVYVPVCTTDSNKLVFTTSNLGAKIQGAWGAELKKWRQVNKYGFDAITKSRWGFNTSALSDETRFVINFMGFQPALDKIYMLKVYYYGIVRVMSDGKVISL